MATKTTNYNLTKPDGSENADIDVINANMDIIDNALGGKAGTSVATTSANGLMSSTDKSKLDGIESGANKITVDSALSSTSTNPLQNKVVNNAIYNLGVQIRAEIPNITISTADPSGGSNGDIWFKYE